MTTRVTRYPGYDVLDKRDTPSWDEPTRTVVSARLSPGKEPHFFNAVEWLAVCALCACVVPQADDPPAVPLAALLDGRLHGGRGDGYRDARLPPLCDAWHVGLAALDAESRARHELPFASLARDHQNGLLEEMQRGAIHSDAWHGMPPELFFKERVLHDICGLYYAHPHAWSEIGFGGPANPRGYVRMTFDRRDPWEPVEAHANDRVRVERYNRHVR